MNRSDRIYVTNGWVLFGGAVAVALDAISAIYVDVDFDTDKNGNAHCLRVERRGQEQILFAFRGTRQECRNRLRQFQRQVSS